MDKDIVKRILSLDHDFYQQYAESFSRSRGIALKGWFKVKEIIENDPDLGKKQNLTVVDLGAGNCRFYSFLVKNLKQKIEYTGIDENDKLIEISKESYGGNKGFKIRKTDVIQNLSSISEKGDIVCAFGLTHHIPSDDLRDVWFSNLHRLVNPKGLLILTFWNTKKTPIKTEPIKTEAGDKFLGWQGKQDYPRYVHVYSEPELSIIIKKMEKDGLVHVSGFIEDQNKNSSNKYLIFKKWA